MPISHVMGRFPTIRHVLVVEDNPGDVLFISEVLDPMAQIQVARDGQAAMDALDELEARGEPPALITLDLNLPYYGGLELLDRIRSSEVLGSVPVVVMSTSDAPEDIGSAYARRANSYIPKGTTLEDFTRLLRSLGRYWLEVAEVPAPIPQARSA